MTMYMYGENTETKLSFVEKLIVDFRKAMMPPCTRN